MALSKDRDWFVKEPFLVPVGTKLTYTVKIYLTDFLYVYEVLIEFMSNSTENIQVKGYNGEIHEMCASPAFYVNFDKTCKITFELPSENSQFKFTVGKAVYEISTGKKLEVASEQSANKSTEYVYCNIPGEKGVYLIDKDELSFVPPRLITKTVLFKDQTTLDEIEFFPSTPSPEQFEAMQDLANLNQDEYQPNSQGAREEPNFKQVDFSEELADLYFNQAEYFNGFIGEVLTDKSESIPNSQGGIKFDSKKARPTLLLKSMPHAVQEVIDVLELGARKYAPDNWKKVENERYHDAMLRHVLSYLAGETLDPETSKHHLAHAICNMLFLIEKEGADVTDAKEKESTKVDLSTKGFTNAQRNQD